MRMIGVVLLSGLIGGVLGADEPLVETPSPAEPPTSFWMEKKLEYAGEILRGLAVSDFELIRTNAQQMHLLNKVEGFVRRRNPEYRTNVHTFERITSELVRQAEKENIDGATIAFNQMTISCVRCHQSLREAAANGGPPAATNATEKK